MVCNSCWLSLCPEISSCTWERPAQERAPTFPPFVHSAHLAGLYIGQISTNYLMGLQISLLAAYVAGNTVLYSLVTRKVFLKQKEKGNILCRHSQLFQNSYPTAEHHQSLESHIGALYSLCGLPAPSPRTSQSQWDIISVLLPILRHCNLAKISCVQSPLKLEELLWIPLHSFYQVRCEWHGGRNKALEPSLACHHYVYELQGTCAA